MPSILAPLRFISQFKFNFGSFGMRTKTNVRQIGWKSQTSCAQSYICKSCRLNWLQKMRQECENRFLHTEKCRELKQIVDSQSMAFHWFGYSVRVSEAVVRLQRKSLNGHSNPVLWLFRWLVKKGSRPIFAMHFGWKPTIASFSANFNPIRIKL